MILAQLFGYPEDRQQIVSMTYNMLILFCRFICATVLHLALLDEVNRGIEMMKFAINHHYYFVNYRLAFLFGFLQATVTAMVEINNIFIIMFSISPVGIGENFIALAIIADFDNFIFQSMKNECMKKLIQDEGTQEKLLRWRHTTSMRCGDDELSKVRDENGEFRPLKVQWKARTADNKCLFLAYKLYKFWYTAYYFYFQPFVVLLFSIIFPLLFTDKKPHD